MPHREGARTPRVRAEPRQMNRFFPCVPDSRLSEALPVLTQMLDARLRNLMLVLFDAMHERWFDAAGILVPLAENQEAPNRQQERGASRQRRGFRDPGASWRWSPSFSGHQCIHRIARCFGSKPAPRRSSEQRKGPEPQERLVAGHVMILNLGFHGSKRPDCSRRKVAPQHL